MATWGTHFLQAVWFTNKAGANDLKELFTAITGLPPHTVQSKQVFAPQQGFVGQACGDSDQFGLTLSTQPTRVDLVIHLKSSPDGQPPTSLQIPTETTALIGRFKEMLMDCRAFDAVTRLALLATVGQQTADVPTANQLLRASLGGTLPRAEDSDFLLRVNRRTQLNDILCNRVLTWEVAQYQMVKFDLTFQQAPAPQAIIVANPAPDAPVAATLAVDVNTVAMPQPALFSSDAQRTIFAALADEVLRLCQENSLEALQ